MHWKRKASTKAGATMAPADLRNGERLTGAAHDGYSQNRSARDTLNDTVQARLDNVQLKMKTRAGPDNATQDRVGPGNATQTPRMQSPDVRARPRDRQENRRIKNKTVPVRKTIYARFK
ncbi:unnamed protein product [Phytophthora fragariaefolia]|uniref:Unnamed protein product n=1 Tax=Phytophthora fragariaefolia TaxID=1490495 RepID=A0A9W7D394_9STRA|nr:unnamed protein product [Phytophthora fragariaefolia]